MASGVTSRYMGHPSEHPPTRSIPTVVYGVVTSALWLIILYFVWPLVVP
jgi:hypothetical protein